MRGRNRYLAVLAVLSLVGAGASLFGCDWFDEKKVAATPPTPPLSGFAFTSATMEQAAGTSAGTVDFFNQIGLMFAGIVQNIPGPTPVAPAGPVPRAPVPLGSSGLCLSATQDNVIWNDNDGDTLPSAGDTITVALQNCFLVADGGNSIISGSPNPAVTFTVASASEAGIVGTLALNLTSAPKFDPTDSTDIDGIMAASFSALSFPAATVTLGQVNGTAANTQITIVDSAGSLAFGCFDVNLTFPDATDPFNFETSVRGIAKVQSYLIMQLGNYGVGSDPNPLVFQGGTPVSGELKLLSFDSRPTYGQSSCYGTVTGTTSELVTALGGSSVRLDTFGNTTWSGTPDNTINTTWGALLN